MDVPTWADWHPRRESPNAVLSAEQLMPRSPINTVSDNHAANNFEGRGVADIVQRLEEEIALGLLSPRERLVEDDLLARFNVKRHVVRQALAELELMGMVIRRPN